MRTLSRLMMVTGLVVVLHATANAGPGGEGFHKKIMKQLDISAEQKTQLKNIKEKSKGSMDALHDQVKAAHDKLDEAFEAGVSDTELTTLHSEVVAARGEMGTKRFGNLLEIRKVLTSEQRKKFDTLSVEMKKKKKERRRRHKGME